MFKKTPEDKSQVEFILADLNFRPDCKYFSSISRHKLSNTFSISIHSRERGDIPVIPLYIAGFTVKSVLNATVFEMRKNPARWEKQIEALKLSPEHKFPGFQNSYTFGYNIKTKYEDALFNYMQKFKNFVRNIDFEQNIFQDNVANITSYKNEENNKHYANYDYRVISAAFEIVKSICLQNRDDFKKKTSPNRDGIIIAMAKLYPEQVNPLKFGMKINLPAGYQLRIGEKIPYTR